jgi:hypothetical protein
MTDLVVVEEIEILTQEVNDEILLEEVEVIEILTAAEQGPRGIQGIPGPAGGETLVTVGADPISGHSAVAMDADGLLIYADCTDASQIGAALGVVANAYSAGDPAVVQTGFDLAHSGWAFSPGPVFVGESGALVQTLPPGAVFAQVVGFALSATRIRIDVQPPIVLT